MLETASTTMVSYRLKYGFIKITQLFNLPALVIKYCINVVVTNFLSEYVLCSYIYAYRHLGLLTSKNVVFGL